MTKIAFVTCKKDNVLVRAGDDLALAQMFDSRHEVTFWAWNDETADWKNFDKVIVRSCWDYHLHPAAFTAWLHQMRMARVNLFNDPETILWNMDKHYLDDLRGKNIEIVPTVFVDQPKRSSLSDLMFRKDWDVVVVKPSISASGYKTMLVSRKDGAVNEHNLSALFADGSVLVQPFMPEIRNGEWSFIFIGNQFSHAVLKRAKEGDFRVQQDYGGTVEVCEPPPAALKDAEEIVSRVNRQLLYARIDGIIVGGKFVLMEAELIEPQMFLLQAGDAIRKFASAILSC